MADEYERGGFRLPQNIVVVGVTGGIASGKSTVTEQIGRFLTERKAVILNADHFGHKAYASGTSCFNSLVTRFGEKIVASDGSIDRKALGKIVFANKKDLQDLNSIVWPAIYTLLRQRIFEESKLVKENDYAVIVLEAAVLIEANWIDLVDEIWLVTSTAREAILRLMKRNGISEEDAKKRMEAQISNDERRKFSHVEIINDSDSVQLHSRVKAQVQALITRYNRLSSLEYVDVVDPETRWIVGHWKRALVRFANLPHRCTFVILRNSRSGQIYVQRRSMLKDYGPGLLDPAPGGVVSHGESFSTNACREMKEEMGLELNEDSLCPLFSFFFDEANVRCWGFVFVADLDKPVDELVLQEEEVDAVELLSPEKILSLPRTDFIPCGMAAFIEYWNRTQK